MLELAPLLRYLEGRIVPVEELESKEKRRFESTRESKRDNDEVDEDAEDAEEMTRRQNKGDLSWRFWYSFVLLIK